MPKTYIFAIGGTGARVLRSFTMLLAAGCRGTTNQEDVVPIIIDYDTQNGSTMETQDLLECYQKIHKKAFPQGFNPIGEDKKAVTETFFCTPVQRLKDVSLAKDRLRGNRFELHLESEDVNKKFKDHIGFSTINDVNGTQPTRYLLESLYDTSEGVNAELELSLEKGFKGCPNIGCVVTRNLSTSEEIKQFLTMLHKEDRVLIIGSVFGGTGASGIPMLLDLLTDNANGAGHICPIGVIAVEPYFKVVSSHNSVINSDTFVAKTKAALMAYDLGQSVNRQADFIYYVGDDKTSSALENHEGGQSQKNPAHLVELISGICAMHFMCADFVNNQIAVGASFFEAWMNLEDSDPSHQNANDKEKEKSVITITPDDFPDVLTKDYIEPLFRLALFNQYCKNHFLGCGKGERNEVLLRNTSLGESSEFREQLKKFIGFFDEWIAELQDKRRTLTLLDLTDKKYEHLLVDRVMTSGWINSRIVSDGKISTQLGKYFNNLDKSPDEQNRVKNDPEAYFLIWMDEILTKMYEEIEDLTKKKKQESKK